MVAIGSLSGLLGILRVRLAQAGFKLNAPAEWTRCFLVAYAGQGPNTSAGAALLVLVIVHSFVSYFAAVRLVDDFAEDDPKFDRYLVCMCVCSTLPLALSLLSI